MFCVLIAAKFCKTGKKTLVILVTIFFSILSVVINSEIFNSREASWSTFSYPEIIMYGISSLFPFIVISWGIIWGMIILRPASDKTLPI